MADETTVDETSTTSTAAGATGASTSETGKDGQQFDAERARRTIESQRATERELKARLKELEPLAARARELEDAQRTDLEKAQAKADAAEQRATEAEARARQALVRSAVMVELGKQGAANPARIFALVDQAGLEISDDGTVTGADKAVERLLKDEPYLKAAASANGHGGPPQTPRAAGPPSNEQVIEEKVAALRASGAYGRL